MTDYSKYKIFKAGGKDLRKCIDFKNNDDYDKHVKSVIAEFGAKSAAVGSYIDGLVFAPGEPPVGWVEKSFDAGGKYHRPNTRTKSGKSAWKRLNAVRSLSWSDFSSSLGLAGFGVLTSDQTARGQIIRHASFEEVEGDFFILSPVDNHGEWFTPSESEPVKLSEFYALMGE